MIIIVGNGISDQSSNPGEGFVFHVNVLMTSSSLYLAMGK